MSNEMKSTLSDYKIELMIFHYENSGQSERDAGYILEALRQLRYSRKCLVALQTEIAELKQQLGETEPNHHA